MMHYKKMESPVGTLHLLADDSGLHALAFDANWKRVLASFDYTPVEREHPVLKQAIEELQEYFAGERKDFTVPLAMQGTDFQYTAWCALQEIEYGKTASYREQAEKMKKPKAMRAVGKANSMNPIAILVPCHRVVGADGSLTGYAGGMDVKKALLDLEKGMKN